jgi:hypothetical protein
MRSLDKGNTDDHRHRNERRDWEYQKDLTSLCRIYRFRADFLEEGSD